MFINPIILYVTNYNIAGFFSYKTVSIKLVIEVENSRKHV